jgi:hypothetical protein
MRNWAITASRMSETEQAALIAAAEQVCTKPRLTKKRLQGFVRNAAQLITDLEAATARYNEHAATQPLQLLNILRKAARLKLLGEDVVFAHLKSLHDGPISDDGLQVGSSY